MKRFRKSEGFTLIELLIVIIIIGILAAIAIPMFLGQRDKAKESAVKEGVHSIQIGVQSYAVDNNDDYPATAGVNNTTHGVLRRHLAEEPVGHGGDERRLGDAGQLHVHGSGSQQHGLQPHRPRQGWHRHHQRSVI